MILSKGNVQSRLIHRDRVDFWLPGAGGEGRRVIANGEGVSIWEDEDVLELARSGGCKTL